MTKKSTKNYVNKDDLLSALIQYKKQCKESEDSGEALPRVPDYIGMCIYQISNRIASRPNFSGYSFKEDMIQDGIENCLLYIRNFDAEKSSNPFGYFSRIIWYAFLRKIQKEKKQMYVRFKSSQELISMGETYEGGSEIQLHLNTSPDYMNDFIEDYEKKLSKNKEKTNDTGDH